MEAQAMKEINVEVPLSELICILNGCKEADNAYRNEDGGVGELLDELENIEMAVKRYVVGKQKQLGIV